MTEEPTFWSSMMEHWELARTLRKLKIYFDPALCTGVYQCVEVCPVGSWLRNPEERKAVFIGEEICIACGACVLQCPEQAIRLE